MTTHDDDRDDAADPVMEWALHERLGGERAPDLLDAVRARLAETPAPAPSTTTPWLVAATVLLGLAVVLGVAFAARPAAVDVASTGGGQEPGMARVYSLADIEALPATTRAVEAMNVDDAAIAALHRLRDLEELVVREPFHENQGLGLKMAPPPNPPHVTAAAWPHLLSFTKLRRLELSGTLLAGRVEPAVIAEGLERLPVLTTLALRYLDTSPEVVAVLPKARQLQVLDLSYNHGFDETWIDAIVQMRALRVLTLTGCQQIHGRELARVGELTELEQLDVGQIDGINWRNSGQWLDDTEKQVVAAAHRRADRIGMGPTAEALVGIARCQKLRVLDISGGHWHTSDLAAFVDHAALRVLLATGGQAQTQQQFMAAMKAAMQHRAGIVSWGSLLPTGLERLDVCGDHDDAFCRAIAEHLPNLRHLNLAACYRITDAGIAAVAAMPSLRVLDMRQMRGLTAACIASLAQAKQLESVDLRHCDFVTAEHVVALRSALPNLQSLESNVPPEAIAMVQSKHPVQVRNRADVERLPVGTTVVEGLGLDDDGIAALKRLRQLRELALRGTTTHLAAFAIPHNPATAVGLAHLLEIPTLQHLVLDRARDIEPTQLVELARLPVLTELECKLMVVPDEVLTRFAGTPLTALRLDGCRGFGDAGFDAITRMRSLRVVSFVGCSHLDERQLARLAELPALEVLDLSFIGHRTMFSGQSEFGSHLPAGTGVSTFLLQQLGKVQSLVSLDIAYGEVTSEGLGALAEAKNLCNLNLAGSQVRTSDLDALPKGLTILRLDNCRELDQGCVAKLVNATPKLTQLSLARLDAMTDAWLEPLRGLRSLDRLDLSHSSKLTMACVASLRATAVSELRLHHCPWWNDEAKRSVLDMPSVRRIETENSLHVVPGAQQPWNQQPR